MATSKPKRVDFVEDFLQAGRTNSWAFRLN